MMNEKILLILADGLRPDALKSCTHPYSKEFTKNSVCYYDTETVFPSVTLPCHMSLFHSVDPTRHGVTTNIYTPQVRPIDGIFDVLKKHNKQSAFFYDWEELRDLGRPGTLAFSTLSHAGDLTEDYIKTCHENTAAAISCIQKHAPDFVFLYIGLPDEAGHQYGWLSAEYENGVRETVAAIEKIMATLSKEYNVILTADHGGHERTHGTTQPEDMTIPLILHGTAFEKADKALKTSIKDIAPTILKVFGIVPPAEWEGMSLI